MADEMAVWIDTVSPPGQHHLRLAFDISSHILHHIYSVQIRKTDCHNRRDDRGPVLAALFMRSFSLYQATFLLARRGMASDSALTCRGLLDSAFKFLAIRRDVMALNVYIAEDKHHRLKLIKNLLKQPELLPASASVTALEETCRKLKEEVDDSDHKRPWHISEWAQRAEMIAAYRTAYAMLSADTHSSPRSLSRMLVVDADNDLEAMAFEGGVEPWALATATDFILILCRGFSDEFNLRWHGFVESSRDRLQKLLPE